MQYTAPEIPARRINKNNTATEQLINGRIANTTHLGNAKPVVRFENDGTMKLAFNPPT